MMQTATLTMSDALNELAGALAAAQGEFRSSTRTGPPNSENHSMGVPTVRVSTSTPT